MVDEKLAQSVSLTFKHSKIDNLIEGGNIHCKRVMSSPDKSPRQNDGSRSVPKSTSTTRHPYHISALTLKLPNCVEPMTPIYWSSVFNIGMVYSVVEKY